MNALEIKGDIFDLLWGVDDETTLVQVREAIYEVLDQEGNSVSLDEILTKEQQAELEEAILECEDESSLIPHDEAMKQIKSWLQK